MSSSSSEHCTREERLEGMLQTVECLLDDFEWLKTKMYAITNEEKLDMVYNAVECLSSDLEMLKEMMRE
jgi:hypothetical protein